MGVRDLAQLALAMALLVGCRKGPTTTDPSPIDAGDPRDSTAPYLATSTATKPDLVADGSLVCVVGLAENKAKCWGSNRSNLLGDSRVLYRHTATEAAQLHDVTAMANGCVLRSDVGAIDCDPRFFMGHLVLGVTPNPVDWSATSRVQCVLKRDGFIDCWGNNEAGMLGDGSFNPREIPSWVRDLPLASEVRVSPKTVFARTRDGSVFWWGRGKPLPQPFPELGNVASLRGVSAIGDTHCALRANGDVACWKDEGAPTVHEEASPAIDLATGQRTACAVAKSGRVGCWGTLANPGRHFEWVPGAEGAKRIVVTGDDAFCALTGDAANPAASCWGSALAPSPLTYDAGVASPTAALVATPVPGFGGPPEPACTPSCNAKHCGDDGCGNNACGVCDKDERCYGGTCVSNARFRRPAPP